MVTSQKQEIKSLNDKVQKLQTENNAFKKKELSHLGFEMPTVTELKRTLDAAGIRWVETSNEQRESEIPIKLKARYPFGRGAKRVPSLIHTVQYIFSPLSSTVLNKRTDAFSSQMTLAVSM